MKAYETKEMSRRWAFRRFAVTIEIENLDQLRALTEAAGKMTNGHGLELYGLLKPQLEGYEFRVSQGDTIE